LTGTAGAAVAAVDWGGTWLRAAVAIDGELVRQARHRRPDGSVAEQCDFLCELVERQADELGRPVSALGVGIAGITRGGWVESASNIGIHRPYDLATRLRGCLDVPVVVVNDAQAAAVAEAASLGPGTAVLITVGTGIGGAIVADGRLVLGEGAAGDFGHLVMQPGGPVCACGGRGCLEQFVSGRVLDEVARDLAASGKSDRLAALAAERDAIHAGDLDAAALADDPAALAALDRAAATFASALRSITAAADPHVIILGGGLMTSERLLPQLVRDHWIAERPAWSPAELRPALLGPDAGLRGAALLATVEANDSRPG
jgi:glucokinase